MSKEPLTISWDELNTRKVDQRLREQQALTRNRTYARLNADDLPAVQPDHASLLNSTTFCMGALGLVGGLLAWGCGFLTVIRPAELKAVDLMKGIEQIQFQRDNGVLSQTAAEASISMIRAEGESNAYFGALNDPGLTATQRARAMVDIGRRAEVKRYAIDVLSFGLCGMFLAMCLGIGEPLSERNLPRGVRNGALGAVLGLMGGVGVSLFIDRLYRVAGGGGGDAQQYTFRDVLALAFAWGVLGLFLAAGPGLLMGNLKKIAAGLIGGLVGGAIGGALFDPVSAVAGPHISRLVALCAIGVLTGVGTGLIENAAKAGWLKVTAGLIAGKQFILYRNPTYIGSGPECQIYLFRDPNVGRRHAALHMVPGGIELEDLPLGKASMVNGQPVTRARLHHGDQISIGATTFLFQEKVKQK